MLVCELSGVSKVVGEGRVSEPLPDHKAEVTVKVRF